MAILGVDKIWSGETWSDESDTSRAYEELYRVYSDDPEESPVTVRAHPDIPAIRSVHPDDSAAWVKSRSARRLDNSRLIWEVTVNYEWSLTEPEDNPLDEPVQIRWTAGRYTRPVIRDRNGDAIVNSAGDFFDPPPEANFSNWTITIQANVAEVPVAILSYAGATNTNSCVIDGITIAATKAQIVGLDISEEKEENDVQFRTMTMAIELNEDGYDMSLLDQGYRIKDGSDLKDVLIEDEDGNMKRPTSPILLNGSGAKLSDPGPTTAVFLDFEVPPRLDFSGLPGIA